MQAERPPGLDKPWVPVLIKWMSKVNVWMYQKTNGSWGGTWFLHQAPIALLTTLGRKSGKPRVTPLLFLKDGWNVVVVASQGGLPTNPQWYYNIISDPQVELQIKAQREPRIARVAEGSERQELWEKLVRMYPDYNNYQQWTERQIPVVVLEPVAKGAVRDVLISQAAIEPPVEQLTKF